jgi:protocatechuate 3,4-dioxygenase beta subunit
MDPPLDWPDYRSTRLRHPKEPLLPPPPGSAGLQGPTFRAEPGYNDLTAQHDAEPIGERIIVSGRVLDTDGRPLSDTLVEVWQANAAGRYRHRNDTWPAPLDPNFDGAGRCVTDEEGRYSFVTVKPGPYPWGNHHNAWRPAHIHFSLLGWTFEERLVTQMYFPGDPLQEFDPIFNAVRDERARQSLIAAFSMEDTHPDWATAYRWDIVL